ncbi:protein FAM114A2 [Amyelois transitella]|uniref:protein FAM114A2 n=1 Tax=Amyelois transitella TaxID=680683 RepID=UPI00067B270F|nr:protein FAM114A2 [Amyelois transitella]
MPTSDSEDFESADEGQSVSDKKERKKRLSSSNYSDNALETDQELHESSGKTPLKKIQTTNDGWDDFDIDENETSDTPVPTKHKELSIDKKAEVSEESELKNKKLKPKESESQDTGWDDFGDWGQDEVNVDIKNNTQPKLTQSQRQPDKDIHEVTDRLAATSTKSSGSGWGWGWGVDSLLSSATAGITTITSQVSQGISTVLETGIGAPDPEELARRNLQESESKSTRSEEKPDEEPEKNAGEAAFPFGSLISGVTKFVETTSTKVISGGLDTLETIGKKTMEVLQDGDPGLVKKRAMLGLESGDKPVLSQVLREAKEKAEEDDRRKEEKREAKEVHYETLFDDFEGLVHLEALEMLSRQVTMRIEERLRAAGPEKRQDIKETLQQVSELCEMPDEEEEDDEEPPGEGSKADALHEKLQTATQDLGLKLQFQPLVKQYTDTLSWLDSSEPTSQKAVYKRSVSALAQSTALSVEMYHKAAEMLLVKTRRSTADEADALTQMTVVLTKHIGELATLFTEKLNSITEENKEQNNNYITNIFLEAGNSSTYIQNAFQLTLPILQIGAV